MVLSASRRTDIPAFFMPWFMHQIHRGFFEVENPYNRRISRVTATADQVHSIVFWSKDFGIFLKGDFGKQLTGLGYHLFFNFTINSPHPLLEPALPPLAQRMAQLADLCDRFGPQTIQWRFDPICFFSTTDGHTHDNLDRFTEIASAAASLGIKLCITSFVDPYRKVLQRCGHAGISLVEPELAHKTALVTSMAETLDGLGVALHVCCEKEVLTALPEYAEIRGGACIPGSRLAELYGPDLSLARDPGQRASVGCGCTVSRDIGSYRLHSCRHNCLYCYANPSIDQNRPSRAEHPW